MLFARAAHAAFKLIEHSRPSSAALPFGLPQCVHRHLRAIGDTALTAEERRRGALAAVKALGLTMPDVLGAGPSAFCFYGDFDGDDPRSLEDLRWYIHQFGVTGEDFLSLPEHVMRNLVFALHKPCVLPRAAALARAVAAEHHLGRRLVALVTIFHLGAYFNSQGDIGAESLHRAGSHVESFADRRRRAG